MKTLIPIFVYFTIWNLKTCMIHDLCHPPSSKICRGNFQSLERNVKIERWNYVWVFFLPMSSEQQTWTSLGSIASVNVEHINLYDRLLGEEVRCSASELSLNLFLVNITILACYIGLWLMDDICLDLDWVLIYHVRLQLTGSLFQFIWGFLQKNSKTSDGSR